MLLFDILNLDLNLIWQNSRFKISKGYDFGCKEISMEKSQFVARTRIFIFTFSFAFEIKEL